MPNSVCEPAEPDAVVTCLFGELVGRRWAWSQAHSRTLPELWQAVLDAVAGSLDDAGLVVVCERSTSNPVAARTLAEQCRAVVRAVREGDAHKAGMTGSDDFGTQVAEWRGRASWWQFPWRRRMATLRRRVLPGIQFACARQFTRFEEAALFLVEADIEAARAMASGPRGEH